MRNLGGWLASSATAAIAGIGLVDPMLCSIDDGSGGASGGGGGAASFLDEDPGAGAGGTGGEGAGAGAGDGEGGSGGEGGGGPAAVPEWAKTFSADKTGDELSHQEWLAKKGFADPNALVASYRQAEKTIREGGKVKIPGEGASEAEIAAYREAIGVPKDAAGYAVNMPEGAAEFELDTAVLEPLREAALKHNVPAGAFQGLADVFLNAALEHAKAEVARTDTDAAEKVKEWGAEAPAKKEEFRRAALHFGLTKSDVADIQREFGAGKTLDLFAKIGRMMGEDFFAGGQPAQRFGVANLEQAEAALNAFINDPEKANALRNGTDKNLEGQYNRAVEAVAAFRQSASKQRR